MGSLGGLLICLTISPFGLFFSIFQLFYATTETRKWLPLMIFSLGLLAYAYEPIHENDLTRYLTFALESSNYDFLETFEYFINQYPQDMGVPVYVFVQWICGKLGCVHLIPMFSLMIVYGVSFYISSDLAARFQVKKLTIYVILLQISLLPFLSIAGNVRNICAFALVILAVYRDSVMNKKNITTILLYILPVFIHTAALILIGIRMLIGFNTRYQIFVFGGVVFLPQVVNFLFDAKSFFALLGPVGDTINLVILKIYLYLNDVDSEWAQAVINSRFQTANKFVLCSLAVLICILIYFYINKIVQKPLKRFLNYEFFLCALTISTLWFAAPHYWRFACTFCIAIAIVFFSLYEEIYLCPLWVRICRKVLFAYIPICIALNWYIGGAMVNYIEWIEKFFMTNIFTIGLDIISATLL